MTVLGTGSRMAELFEPARVRLDSSQRVCGFCRQPVVHVEYQRLTPVQLGGLSLPSAPCPLGAGFEMALGCQTASTSFTSRTALEASSAYPSAPISSA